MITTCDTQDFVPFGRHYVDRRHPGKFQLQVQNHVQTDHGLPLYKSFRDISIQDNNSKVGVILVKLEEETAVFVLSVCLPVCTSCLVIHPYEFPLA